MIDGSGLMRTALTGVGVDPAGLATDQLLDQVTASDWLVRVGLNSRLISIASWADRFPADSIAPHQLAIPGGDRPIRPGGDGTPEITRFCVTDLAAQLHKSTGTAERMIADALDLRHRLPRVWVRLCRYEIDGLDGQTIARQTRHLTLEQALEVDRSIADFVGRFSYGRLLSQLEAIIIRVDADNIAKLAEQAAEGVGVWINQSNDHGIKGMFIKAKTPAVIRFYAQVSRIADILARRGHPGSKDERLAAAIDVLANPLDAVRMIAEDTEPTLFDPDPDDDSLLPRPMGGAANERDGADDGVSAEGSVGDNPETREPSTASPSDDGRTTDGSTIDGSAADWSADEDAVSRRSSGGRRDDHGDLLPPDPTDDAFDQDQASTRFPRVDQDRQLAELAIRAIGQIDPAKFRPNATLYVHIAKETLDTGLGVTRVEDIGPMVSTLVADWLGECNITVKPVIDLSVDLTPVDSYEIPRAMREHLFLKYPGSMFPFSGSVGRHLDLDHNIPFVEGLPAQTREDRLGPNGRREHNVITHGLWKRRRAEPGTFLFRAPDGRVFLVDATGSHDLGRGQFAQHVWHSAAPTPPSA
ncbi:DUF222 domain-containing protein [Microlunatus soli]|uniref:DUF222 domain-containing protein n=1 Tax=Microlunatus soli TaxID=630515 RepID=A0A1H1YVB8_9ACTN|nr:DUF222 domain-containing protein [Microlunatus soli]SDT25485.1 hypothetical protein SAMN04489812_4810 [Microlunatus soli]